ncbi:MULTISPECIES: hypothetical protein [unclassified Corynebacterium]|uniref:hypothetical protein n=1 Tax=unclassified Corynebacterium TaxID=2624378 RepID=UPI003525E9EB
MKLISHSTLISAVTTTVLTASVLSVPAWAEDTMPGSSSSEVSGSTEGSVRTGSNKDEKSDKDSAGTEEGTGGTTTGKSDAEKTDPIATAVEGSSDNALSSGIGSSEKTEYKNLDGDTVEGPRAAMVITKIMQIIKAVVGIISLLSAAASLTKLIQKYLPH